MPWDDVWQEVFDDIPGVHLFRDYEYETSRELFEAGFTHHANEAGYDPDVARSAREEFFDFTGLPEEMFPWDEWREAMGYEDE